MRHAALLLLSLWLGFSLQAQMSQPLFNVISFYTAKQDPAHISFVHEANVWFAEMGKQYGFRYDSTNDWNKLRSDVLAFYQVVIFLDTRPDSVQQREAFERYMKGGGAWMGFHFSAFALTPSAYPQNWSWYHEQFLGSGEYQSNTWRPTAAQLRVEQPNHPATRGLPVLFTSSPNEWYRWKNDLRKNKDIEVLLSIDSSSFPLGTGPKPFEIWYSGDYPVVWTNKRYRMIYFNMGHNDMDYENKTNKTLSYTFRNPVQDRLVLKALLWLGKQKSAGASSIGSHPSGLSLSFAR
jgi:hypothetical protein